MHKSTDNGNRIRSILDKFENNNEPTNKQLLERQLSDPIRKNIKRTPAFRLDRNTNSSHFKRANSIEKSTDHQSLATIDETNCSKNFTTIRNQFNGSNQQNLYTEPIPKALRQNDTKFEHLYMNLDTEIKNDNNLTDTLKNALKKPLPTGPPPRKPPRTFLHSPKSNGTRLKPNIKGDPNYMLNKLENALKNNRLRLKKSQTNDDNHQKLNCLNGLVCVKTESIEKLTGENCEFFVDLNEPVYDEPICTKTNHIKTNLNRNSLYYMSTPIACGAPNMVSTSETSSLTDPDSPPEDSLNIKKLIDAFEVKNDDDIVPKTMIETDNHHRVDDLKDTLQKTLDRCFSSDNDPDHSIKFHTYIKNMPKYQYFKYDHKTTNNLFLCCLIVEWNKHNASIKFKYPKHVDIPVHIEKLCYPEVTSGQLDCSNNAQCYSLVVTNDEGSRTFGYCRRVLPEGSSDCLPITYCILSVHRAPRFYQKILEIIESRHGQSDRLRDQLMNEFYTKSYPQPGEMVRIRLSDGDDVRLTMHNDTRYEDADLRPLHDQLAANVVLKVFASLLLERKVIFVSSAISRLSACVDSLQSILYPFTWPHTFIPILPQCLWDVVESPTPVICGVLSVAVVNEHKIEHGIVVDLDEGTILIEEGDENTILSASMQKIWLKGIDLANTVPSNNYVHSVHLSDAYLRVFTGCMGNYKSFIVDGKFQNEAFIRNGKTKGIRRFLKWFTETTMFLTFIDTVINNIDSFHIFDQKIAILASDESNLILDKLLEWKR